MLPRDRRGGLTGQVISRILAFTGRTFHSIVYVVNCRQSAMETWNHCNTMARTQCIILVLAETATTNTLNNRRI